MRIFCTTCKKKVDARLTDGKEIYPHRPDLHVLPIWICTCGNYVGCHHKTDNPIKPLGVLADKELKKAKIYIHALIDPLWKGNLIKRKELYKKISDRMGFSYHTGALRSLDEARKVYRIGLEIKKELESKYV